MVKVDDFEGGTVVASIAVIEVEGERDRGRVGANFAMRENLEREGVGAGLGNIDAVGSADEVEGLLVSWLVS